MWTRLIGLSISGVLLLDYFPIQWFGDKYFQGSIASYAFFGLILYLLVVLTGSSSLQYFRLPRWHFKSLITLLWVVPIIWINVVSPDNVNKSLSIAIPGVIYLFFIGFGEEILSRGLVFGVLQKFGLYKAVALSSLLFGLMHLNLYIGADWDPWQAYAHVLTAASFGVLSCGLMILTRSIWSSVILHLFSNWGLVFGKLTDTNLSLPDWWFDSWWSGFTYPLPGALNNIGIGVLFIVIDRAEIPQFLYRLALKWKLVAAPK